MRRSRRGGERGPKLPFDYVAQTPRNSAQDNMLLKKSNRNLLMQEVYFGKEKTPAFLASSDLVHVAH